MALTDPIADMLSCIRNGQNARLIHVDFPSSKMRKAVLDVLRDEGYVGEYEETEIRDNVKRIELRLRYHQGRPAIKTIKRVSKPGRRVYSSAQDIPKVANGLGISIVSTAKGLMADHKARRENVGGEIICEVR